MRFGVNREISQDVDTIALVDITLWCSAKENTPVDRNFIVLDKENFTLVDRNFIVLRGNLKKPLH